MLLFRQLLRQQIAVLKIRFFVELETEGGRQLTGFWICIQIIGTDPGFLEDFEGLSPRMLVF